MEKAKREAERAGHTARSAASTMLGFTRYMDPAYIVGWFNQDICRRLDKFIRDVEAGLSPRLMIFAPPRHGKSRLGSVNLPAYVLGKHPEWEVIAAAHTGDRAEEVSQDVQRLIDSDLYRTAFPATRLARSNSGRVAGEQGFKRRDNFFEVVGNRGSYRAIGVDVSITGRGGNVIIIDDPVKDAKTAASPTYRESTYDWYVQTIYTRLEPLSGIIIINTRWHMDDLSGRLLEAMKNTGDQWEVVSYPAIAEEDEIYRKKGEALFSERFNLERLLQIKGVELQYAWQALYQQRPVPREGALFKLAWFKEKIIPHAPEDTQWWRHWDLAASLHDPKQPNQAWTAGVKMGWSPSTRKFYVADVVRFKVEGYDLRLRLKKHAEEDTRRVKISIPIDPGAGGKFMTQDIIATLQGFTISGLRESDIGGKYVRAEPFASQCQAGNVYLIEGDWITPYLEELGLFPSSAAKDQVDASSGAFARLTGGGAMSHNLPYIATRTREFP